MSTRKPVKWGADYVRGNGWEPKVMTRKSAQKIGDQHAAKQKPKGFWHASVADCGDYYRINIGGDPAR